MRTPLGRFGLPAAMMAGLLALPATAPRAVADALPASTAYAASSFFEATASNPYVSSGVSFAGGSGSINPNSTFHVGDFVISPQAVGATTTAVDTPFVIALNLPEYTTITPSQVVDTPSGPAFGPTVETMASLLIGGHLVGAITPSGQATLTATFDTVQVGGLVASSPTNTFNYAFPVPASTLMLPSMLTLNGQVNSGLSFGVYGYFTPPPVPEPATLATLVAGLGVLAARRRRGRASA